MSRRLVTGLVLAATSLAVIALSVIPTLGVDTPRGVGSRDSSGSRIHAKITVADRVTMGEGDCRFTKVEVSGNWNIGYDGEVEVRVYRPNQDEHDYAYFADDVDGYVMKNVWVCKRDPAGVYRVEVSAWASGDAEGSAKATDSASFTVVRSDI